MLNSLVQSLWKTCVHTFLYHNLGIHALIIISFMYGFFNPYVFLFTLFLILVHLKSLHVVSLFIGAMFVMTLIGLHAKTMTEIKGEVKVVQVIEKTYQSQYRIRVKHRYVLLYAAKGAYEIGDVLFVDAKVTPFTQKTRPFGIDFKSYYKGFNTHGTLDIKTIEVVRKTFHINALRQFLMDETNRFKSKEVFHAFIFDVTPDLDTNMNWLYLMRMSGIHIVFIIEILRLTFKKRLHHPLIPLAMSLVFLILQDFNPSVLRLSMYYGLNFILFKKHIIVQRSLKIVLTWLFQLIIMPYLMYHIGLLITYIIVLNVSYIQHTFKRYHALIKMYVTSLSVQLILLPLSHVFALTQVFFTPFLFVLIFFVLYPFMLLTLLIPVLDPWLFLFYQWIVFVVESLDTLYFSVHIKAFSDIFLVLGLIICTYVLRSLSVGAYVKRMSIVFFVIALHMVSFQAEGIRVYALDTGQGDSNIVYSKDCTIVIDAFQFVEETLLGLGVKTIDYVFITHDDIDHVKELKRLEKVFNITHIITNPYTILGVKEQTFIEIPQRMRCGDIDIHVLGPLKDYKNDNDNSLIIKLDMYGKSILYLGDSSKEVELDLLKTYEDFLKVDILKIGHHGSKTSTHEDFIYATEAALAIISVGRNNRYNMPHQEVIQTLREGQLHILRTDTMGTIVLFIDKKNVSYRFYEP